MNTIQRFRLQSSLTAALASAILAFTPVSAFAATTEKFTNSTSWACPVGVTVVTVECWGGGGAGGGGAYAKLINIPVTPGTVYAITIPSAATCVAGFVNGQAFDGADVTFTGDGGIFVTANGGKGGSSAVTSGATAVTGAGGLGGAAGVGHDAAWAGGNGSAQATGNGGAGASGASDLGNGNNGSGGVAGTTKLGSDIDHNGGAGAAGKTGAGNGNGAGAQPGGGGGGAKASVAGTTFNGSAGGKGQMILTYTVAGTPTVKANNVIPLNDPASWTDHIPTSTESAKWDSTVTAANATLLGGDLTFGGISILDPAGLVTINAGSTLTLGSEAVDFDLSAATADLTLNCALALDAPNVWDVTSGRTLTLAGIVSGAQPVTKQGAGRVILSATNSYTGATAVNGGTLQLGANDAVPDGTGKGDVTVVGTLDLNGFSDTINGLNGTGIVENTAVSITSKITVGSNNASSTFAGVIRNSGVSSTTNLVKIGSGTLTMSGTSTFTGTASVFGGNLSLGTANPFGSASELIMGGGTTLGTNSNNIVVSAPITLSGNVNVMAQSTSALLFSLNGGINGSGNLTLTTVANSLGNVDNKVSIGASGSLLGNILITTQNTTNNMTLRLGAPNALPTTAEVTIDGGNGNGTGPAGASSTCSASTRRWQV